MEKTVLHIENLDCPVCAEALQGDLQKIKGVNSVSVDYVTQTITLEAENETVVRKVIDKTNKFEEVRVLDGGRYATNPKNRHIKEWIFIGVSVLLLAVGILLEYFTSGLALKIVAWCLYGTAYLTVGHPVLISTFKNIIKGRIFDENFLMTLASIGAIVIGEYSESVLVMLLYQIGELLQSIAVGSSRQSVAKLMELKSEWATVLKNGEQLRINPEEVQVGDVLLVKAGEKVPVDGVLLDETATFDTKSLTGETELKTVKKGEEILSGYINAGGVYEMKCIRPYADSAVGRILDMVEHASSGKAKPEKFIAKFAKIYTPVVCGLAVLVAVCGPLLHGFIAEGRIYFKEYAYWLKAALTFLVISCPCALVISVPLSYYSGIGACAKNGVLVKGATYLDVLAKAKIVAFDKTGTLTEGNFTICGVYPESGVTETELLSLAASVENASSHPIAKAFENVPTSCIVEQVTEAAGRGLKGVMNGETVLVGNGKLLAENGVSFAEKESIYTLVYVAKGERLLGVIEIGDKLRPETKIALTQLQKLGLTRQIMLTGDNRQRAEKIAQEIGIGEVNAELLPDEKLKRAEELKEEGTVIYVGDGVNDAPVMVTADCSVSMGKLGSAAAIEASDLVLITDDLTALTKGVRIAGKTRKIVIQNIVFSVVMKVVFMALGIFGLPLGLAVFADVGVMLLAVLNSFRVRILEK
ncbi:MAG: heavy metal translocating P-type ATPase [Clostridia bacterium]|nr:heavy metal translocating P-type ATPase [Clostridia bacterium]